MGTAWGAALAPGAEGISVTCAASPAMVGFWKSCLTLIGSPAEFARATIAG